MNKLFTLFTKITILLLSTLAIVSCPMTVPGTGGMGTPFALRNGFVYEDDFTGQVQFWRGDNGIQTGTETDTALQRDGDAVFFIDWSDIPDAGTMLTGGLQDVPVPVVPGSGMNHDPATSSGFNGVAINVNVFGSTTRQAGPDLSSFNALQFYARTVSGTGAAATIGNFGFASGDGAQPNYEMSLADVVLTQNWTRYVLPIPNPARLTDVDSLFYVGADNNVTRILLDDIQYVSLSDISATLSAASTTGQISAVGGTLQIDPTVEFRVGGDQVTNLNIRDLADYINWTSANTDILTVDTNGVVTALQLSTTPVAITGTIPHPTSQGGSDMATVTVMVTVQAAQPGAAFNIYNPNSLADGFSVGSDNAGQMNMNRRQGQDANDSATVAREGTSISITLPTTATLYGGGFIETMTSRNINGLNLVFDINTASLTGLTSLRLVIQDSRGASSEFSTNLLDLTSVQIDSTDWRTYTIPSSQFTGINLSDYRVLGFWDPRSSSGIVAGTFYLDNIRFEAPSGGQ